jgi:hypothetical protein
MSKKSIVVISLLIYALIISCEENISPKGELPIKYSVNFVLRGDATTQTAYISKLYDVTGFDPSTLDTDPAAAGANVYLKYSDSETRYYLRDTVDYNNLNPSYNTPAKYYFISNFTPISNKQITLFAQMQDGTQLTASSKTPLNLSFDNYKSLSYIPGPLIGRDTTYASIYWDNIGQDVVKARRVKIVYYYRELTGEKTRHEKQVPLKIDNSSGKEIAVYTDFSFQNELKIPRKFLTKALREISEGNSSKGRFSLLNLEVEILSFDENLTKYYSTSLFYDFGFTVRSYPSDLTNINGGLGFFASYLSAKKYLKFDQQYALNEFGYLIEK